MTAIQVRPSESVVRAFNALAAASEQRIKQVESTTIDLITREAKLPAGLDSEPIEGTQRKRPAIFRRTAGSALEQVLPVAHHGSHFGHDAEPARQRNVAAGDPSDTQTEHSASSSSVRCR
jgi:hypothetical protein